MPRHPRAPGRHRRATLSLALTAVLLAGTAPTAPTAHADTTGGEAPVDFTLSVLHGNDPESHLLGAPADADFGGVARYATLLHELRRTELRPRTGGPDEADRRGVVLVNSGDMFLAGPQFAASLEEDAPFYDALALHHMNYDAIAIGNHEWDFGPDLFAEFVEASPERTPWLSANLDVTPEPALAPLAEEGRIAPSTVVRRRGESIGIVGATTDLLHSISSPRDVIVDPDLRGTVQREVDALTAQGVDKIIVISHLQNIVNDKRLVRELRDVDAVITGGGHETHAPEGIPLVPGDSVGIDPETGEPLEYPLWVTDSTGTEVPLFTAGADYKYVNRVVLNFDADGDLVSVGERTRPLRVSGVGDDAVRPHPDVQREIVEPVQTYVDSLGSNVIATSEVALEGRRAPGVRTEETNLGNLLADALLYAGRANAAEFGVVEPDIALQNGGGIRNDSLIPAGEITELDTYGIAPFSNFVSVVPDIPRSQVKELLENSVSSAPAADGRFAQVGGLSFSYDPSRTAQQVTDDGEVLQPGERVRDVELADGTVIVADGEVVDGPPLAVATNDFSARGGDQYPFRDAPFTSVGITYQRALYEYIADELGGQITAANYPEGGSGRIVSLD